MEFINEVWILDENGKLLYSYSKYKAIDNGLLKDFTTALMNFAQRFNKKGLSNFELGDKLFVLNKQGNKIFVGNFDKKIKLKDAIKSLQEIVEKFNPYLPDPINAWRGLCNFI